MDTVFNKKTDMSAHRGFQCLRKKSKTLNRTQDKRRRDISTKDPINFDLIHEYHESQPASYIFLNRNSTPFTIIANLNATVRSLLSASY